MRDPIRYMKNPSKVESDHQKYDRLSGEDGNGAAGTARRSHKTASKTEGVFKSNPRVGGYDKDLVLPDSSGQECCFEERRASARCYTLVSSEENLNLLETTEKNDAMNESSQMDVEESIEEVDMEEGEIAGGDENTAQYDAKLKSCWKPPSSLRGSSNDANVSIVNPRRVLFGANTEYSNNVSVNTSTASSQLNGSFTRAEETINTKLANAEISMMFCSPNTNVSVAETPGKPLFSTHRKLNVPQPRIDENDGADTATLSCLNDVLASNNADEIVTSKSAIGGGAAFSIFQDDDNDDSGEATATISALNDVLGGIPPKKARGGIGFGIYSDDSPEQSRNFKPLEAKKSRYSGEDTASLGDIGDVLGDLESCSVKDEHDSKPKKNETAGFAIYSDDSPVKSPKRNKPASSGLGFEIFTEEEPSASAQKKRRANEPCFGDISRIEEDEKTSNFQMDENLESSANAIDYKTMHHKDNESAMRQVSILGELLVVCLPPCTSHLASCLTIYNKCNKLLFSA